MSLSRLIGLFEPRQTYVRNQPTITFCSPYFFLCVPSHTVSGLYHELPFIHCPLTVVQVLRLEPRCVISNRTGTPLQVMQYSAASKVQRLGGKASGVQPSQGQQPPRTPPGLKGVVADPNQDWTSCMEVPVGMMTALRCCKQSIWRLFRVKLYYTIYCKIFLPYDVAVHCSDITLTIL